jgi:hypothetical protein
MRLWLQAIFLIAASKKGISFNQLHRTLGVPLKSAWFMSHRIREAKRDNGFRLCDEAARELGADESGRAFEKAIKAVVPLKRPAKRIS